MSRYDSENPVENNFSKSFRDNYSGLVVWVRIMQLQKRAVVRGRMTVGAFFRIIAALC